MKLIPRLLTLGTIWPLLLAPVFADGTGTGGAAKTLVLDGRGMSRVRARLADPGSNLGPALAELRQEADLCLSAGPWTVVAKEVIPPSGDKHDYMSVGPYWWPDPQQPDGLPYIRRDGEVNPERMDYDNVGLSNTAHNSLTLALAWYFTQNPAYCDHASELLRTWFLRPDTRMNPNLNFGQAIPGRTEGRGIGIIDTTSLIQVVDAALILESSEAWTGEDADALREWFAAYLDWLRTSPHGQAEARTKNNHGTWYDAQVACFAIYAGFPDVARTVLNSSAKTRIASQIGPNGQQPLELARTKSWDYSVMNLKGFFTLASLAEHLDVDLWTYQPSSGGRIRVALDWLLPFAKRESTWKHEQITEFAGSKLAALLRRASVAYDDSRYESAIHDVMPAEELNEARFQLTHAAVVP